MNAIVFDLDGTLLRSPRPYREILSRAFETVAGESSGAWLDAYDEAFFDAFGALEPDPVRTAAAGLEDGPDPDAFAEALLRTEIETFEPAPNARADLRRLGECHRLGVCTNGVREWQFAKLRAHDLDEHVDAIVASYEAGAHKPDPAPFELLERRLPAASYGMVGDADADVEGARRMGWSAERYDGGDFSSVPTSFGWDRR